MKGREGSSSSREEGGSRSFRPLFCMFCLLFAMAVLLGVPSLLGQGETGQIIGVVADPSGAVVPNANVTVTAVASQFTRTTVTNERGIYAVTNLVPTLYKVSIEVPLFAKAEKQVQVSVGSKVALDFSLTVQASQTTVEVTAGAAEAVNTESQTVGTLIDMSKLESLPTLDRNPYDLMGTAGNVTDYASTGFTGQKRGTGFFINGMRDSSTTILLDGGGNTNDQYASIGQTIPMDAMQEFSVLTSNFTAEYGRASGGIVNVATKSGTNDFHGTVYEFNRDSALSANDFNNNANGLDRPHFNRNQFGYSVGGPIQKNKLTFFNSIEWTRVRSYAVLTPYIPTSQLISAASPYTQSFFKAHGKLISNATPLGTPVNAGQICAESEGACAALPSSTPLFQQVAYSVPSDSGGGDPQNSYSIVVRVDYNMSSNTQMYGRWTLQNVDQPVGSYAASPYADFNTPYTERDNNALFSIFHSFSPSISSQTKFVFSRFSNAQALGAAGYAPGLLFYSQTPATLRGKYVDLPGYYPENPGFGLPGLSYDNTGAVNHDISILKGTHQFRFGGNYTYIQDNETYPAYATAVETLTNGSFSDGVDALLNGTLFQFEVAIDPKGKYPCADASHPTSQCSVNLPVSAGNGSRSNRYHEFAFYGQDSWKVTPRLTLNLGLRWEYFGVQHNKDASLDSNFYLGEGKTIYERVRNGQVYVAPDSPLGSLWKKNWRNFAPRLGFAYDLFGNGKTSVRGGWGISYDRNFGNVTLNILQNPPNYAAVSSFASEQPKGTMNIYTDNFGPLAGSTGSQAIPTTQLRAVNPEMGTAYAHFWSVSFEHQLQKDVVLGVDYSGSKGVNLYSIERLNNPGMGNVYLGDSLTNGWTRLKTTQYSNINFRSDDGTSRYYGVTFRGEMRNLSKVGLTLNANYTYSHARDDLSSAFSENNNNFNLGYLDPFNPELDWGDAEFDIRHRFVLSGTWDLPWGKNKHGVAGHLLEGWSLSPSFSANTGAPFTVFDATNCYYNCVRMMVNGSIPSSGAKNLVVDPSIPNNYVYYNFSPDATKIDSSYANPVVGLSDFGPFPKTMLPRNYFRTPGHWDIDLGASKTTKINERFKFQVRADILNLFNHANMFASIATNEISGIMATTGYIAASRGNSPGVSALVNEHRNISFTLKLIF